MVEVVAMLGMVVVVVWGEDGDENGCLQTIEQDYRLRPGKVEDAVH
jgi:hypothetical protein